jgi:hypothetical protein
MGASEASIGGSSASSVICVSIQGLYAGNQKESQNKFESSPRTIGYRIAFVVSITISNTAENLENLAKTYMEVRKLVGKVFVYVRWGR